MKALISLLFLLLIVTTGFAQTRFAELDISTEKDQEIVVRLAPEMFLNNSGLLSSDSHPNTQFSFLETKTSHTVLFLTKNIIGNKFDLQYTPSSFPKNVTEYDYAIRRQIFIAEPTFQQRRSFHFLFN